MEIRVLQYFLAVAREENISAAAQTLHLSQPTLSRQLKDMEDEFGKQLFVRGNRKISLTEEGMLLKKRAEEIIDLVNKTQKEITVSNDVVAGDVYIGAGETDAIRIIAKSAKALQKEHSNVHFHISSGNAEFVLERLDKGLIDFGFLFGSVDLSKYDYLPIPYKDTWGVLMPKDSPMAKKDFITPKDILTQPLILSQQENDEGALALWMQKGISSLNVSTTYNLIYNASKMVEEGLGYAICLNGLINTTGNSTLCFKPLYPKLEAGLNFIWKKHQVFGKAATKFLDKVRENVII